MTNPNEIWKSVSGFKDRYDVSDEGRVRGWMQGGYRRQIPKVLKLHLRRNGYLYIVLWNRPKFKSWAVHRLVLTTFTQPHSSNIDASHLNGIRTDNRLSNLAWATRKENESHKLIHGTKAVGERNGQSKLTRVNVDEIWMALYKGLPQRLIAKQYGLCQQTISAIASGKTWRDIAELSKEVKA